MAAKNAAPARAAASTASVGGQSTNDPAEVMRKADEKAAERAQNETDRLASENRLPESMAVTNPAPASVMDSASGAFVEEEIRNSIPVDHPSIENNPRGGTSAAQNGGDFNDPHRRTPNDPGFAGQGIDRSVYGDGALPDEVARPKKK